jgi:hypothetical protein
MSCGNAIFVSLISDKNVLKKNRLTDWNIFDNRNVKKSHSTTSDGIKFDGKTTERNTTTCIPVEIAIIAILKVRNDDK